MFETFEQEEKVKERMRKSRCNFEEHVEFLSKGYKDEIEIWREKIKLCRKRV